MQSRKQVMFCPRTEEAWLYSLYWKKTRYTYCTFLCLGLYNLDFSAIIAAEFGRLSMLSLVICSTLWKPATFINISKSASKLFITCLTPSSPLTLKPQTQSLPTNTNFAPRAKALKTSAAPRTPESNMMYVLSLTAALN